MKITKQQLRELVREQISKFNEVVEDSDLGDVLERRPWKNPVMKNLRARAAKTRGTGPYSSQPEPDEQPLPDGVDLEEIKALVAIMAPDDLDELQQHISDILTEPGAPASDWDEDNPSLDPEDIMEAGRGVVMMPNSILRRLGLGDKYMHDDENIFLPVSDSDIDSIPARVRRKYTRGGKR